MLRICRLHLQSGPPSLGQSQQPCLDITSAYSLLRMCYRSIDIRVKSRHGRSFFKKRLIDQWRRNRSEPSTEVQRHMMELAGSFLVALHMEKTNTNEARFQLSRVVAEREREEAAVSSGGNLSRVRKIPRP